MGEIIITSSVLILCILLIRLLFHNRISSRVLYALWLLAALRLMIPVSLPFGNMNELRLADLVRSIESDSKETLLQRLEKPVIVTLSLNGETAERAMRFWATEEGALASTDGPTSVFYAGKLGVSWLDIVRRIWICGMFLVAVWIIATNLVFYLMLRRNRREYILTDETDSYLKRRHIKIYVIDNLSSPCLYGLPGKEAIYLTPDIAEDADRLYHVLTHELCHRKHGDSFWSLLRSILVAVYWFHPLVWVAAVLSKRDCELACDEEALLLLGEEERIPYGETLLSIITRKGKISDVVCTATTMTGSGRSVKERICRIVRQPKVLGITVVAVLTLVAVIVIFCFTKDPRYEGGVVLGQEEVTLTSGDMQITMPAEIGGISGSAHEKGKEDIIIYQVDSGKEVGRFCKVDLKEALQLIDEGRTVVPCGDYGYNYVLWDKLGVVRDRTEYSYTPNAESVEDVNIDELSEGGCYIYLKADYNRIKDKYLEEMEYINGKLEAVTESVIVLAFTQEYREKLYQEMAEHRTPYLGNAPEVGALIQALPVPDGLVYNGISLDTQQEGKYTLHINYDLDTEYINEVDEDMIFFDAVLLFASIGNMDECVIAVDDGNVMWTYTRTELEKVFGDRLGSQEREEDMFITQVSMLYEEVVKYLHE